MISNEGREYIIDIMNNATWINDSSNCETNYIFYTQKQEVHYHSDCGTFDDVTNGRCTTLTEEQKAKINMFLGAENKNIFKSEVNNNNSFIKDDSLALIKSGDELKGAYENFLWSEIWSEL